MAFNQSKMNAASKKANQVLEKLRMTVIERERKEYKRALNDLKSLMSGYYEKYAEKGILNYSQMTQYNRIKSLYDNVKDITNDLYKWQKKEIPTLMKDSYEEAFFRYAYSFQAGGIAINWGLLNEKTIKASIDIPVSGLPVSEILTKNNYNFYLKARQEITQGLIQGESIDEMAKRIKNATEVDLSKAETVARTESTRAAGQGQSETYKRAEEAGVELVKIWEAFIDDKTRDAHIELDQKEADEDGLFWSDGYSAEAPGGFGEASLDINCRCAIRAEVKDFPVKTLEDWENYSSYEDWAEKNA